MITPRNHRWRQALSSAQSADAVMARLHRALDRAEAASGRVMLDTETEGAVRDAGINAIRRGDDGLRPGELVTAACRYAGDSSTPVTQRDTFSELAYQVSQYAFSPFDPAALDAARLRATILDEQGRHEQAGDIWRQLIALFQLTHQPAREQQARLAHAVDLHRAGTCGEALNQMSYAWDLALSSTDSPQPGLLAVLHVYLSMVTACGLDEDREALLAQAAALPAHTTGGAEVVAGTPDNDDAHRPVCAYRTRNGDQR
jgi:hypothetical protein